METKIRFEQLTLGEIKLLQTATGKRLQALGDVFEDPDADMLPMLTALGVILLKRSGNPTATADDADELSMDEIMAAYDLFDDDQGDDADPE